MNFSLLTQADARAQPVTWLSSNRLSSVGNTACISLITDSDLGAKRQVFNNYGLKSNEELLLGYGFVLDPNPDDIVVLRLGSSSVLEEVKTKLRSRGLDATQRFTVERDGIIPKPLLEVMRVMLGGDADAENDGVEDEEEDLHAEHEKEMKAVELELDVLGSLGAMLEDKLEKIPDLSDIPDANIRPHVRSMCELYRQGETVDYGGDLAHYMQVSAISWRLLWRDWARGTISLSHCWIKGWAAVLVVHEVKDVISIQNRYICIVHVRSFLSA